MSCPLGTKRFALHNKLETLTPRTLRTHQQAGVSHPVTVTSTLNGPLLRFERTKERMWVPGAARCAFIGEAIDRRDEIAAFSLEVALGVVCGKELRRRRGIAMHGLVIPEDQRFDQQAHDIGRKRCTFGIDNAHRHL